MKRLLVGIEETETSRDALCLARMLGEAEDAEIHVAAVLTHELSMSTPEEDRSRHDERFDRLMGFAQEELGDGSKFHRLQASSAAAGLTELADELEASAVVIGSAHNGPFGRVLLGDLGSRLTSAAPCSVAIAPRGFGDGTRKAVHRIGVGFNGTAEAEEALAAAAGFAGRWGASLHLVGVTLGISAPTPGLGMPDQGPHWTPHWTMLERDMTKRLERAVEQLEVEADWELLLGDPAEQLARASASMDLLVVGSRRYGPLRRVLLGGASGKLLRLAACPVLLTPRPAREREKPRQVIETLVPFAV